MRAAVRSPADAPTACPRRRARARREADVPATADAPRTTDTPRTTDASRKANIEHISHDQHRTHRPPDTAPVGQLGRDSPLSHGRGILGRWTRKSTIEVSRIFLLGNMDPMCIAPDCTQFAAGTTRLCVLHSTAANGPTAVAAPPPESSDPVARDPSPPLGSVAQSQGTRGRQWRPSPNDLRMIRRFECGDSPRCHRPTVGALPRCRSEPGYSTMRGWSELSAWPVDTPMREWSERGAWPVDMPMREWSERGASPVWVPMRDWSERGASPVGVPMRDLSEYTEDEISTADTHSNRGNSPVVNGLVPGNTPGREGDSPGRTPRPPPGEAESREAAQSGR